MLPALENLLINLLDIGLILSIYLAVKVLRYRRPESIPIDDPKREARMAGAVALIYILFLFICFLVLYDNLVVIWLGTFPANPPFSIAFSFIWISLVSGMDLLIVWIALRYTKQSWKTAGIRRIDSWKTIAMGLIPVAILLASTGIYASFMGGRVTDDGWLFMWLPYFLISASFEEIIVRGYIQTRFVARFGPLKGLTITAMFFTLSHFPVAYLNWGVGDAAGALIYILPLFTAGMLFGYIYHKTQNVVPGIILHSFYNWVQFVWIFP